MDINQYIGLPWVAGGRSLSGMDCWGLLRHVQKEHFGVNLPDAPTVEPYRHGEWVQADQPFHGAGVLLRAGHDPHVGVWLDVDGGGVLHSLRGAGVIFTAAPALRIQGFSKPRFYRFT